MSESNQQLSDMQERCTQLQRALTSSEHDRRVLQERLDTTRAALSEAKKQNHSLMERVQGMQNELGDSEVRRAELETQVRSSHVVSARSFLSRLCCVHQCYGVTDVF